MKQRIRLTETDLHRIVNESVRRILNEGFFQNMGNKIQGAVRGFSAGRDGQMQNEEDANSLWAYMGWIQQAVQSNDPNVALKVCQNIAREYNKDKTGQQERYGNVNYPMR